MSALARSSDAFPPTTSLLSGRLKSTEQHIPGVGRELPAVSVFALLRADAEHLATLSTLEQAAIMEDVAPALLDARDAIWAGSEEDRERQRREKEAALKRYREEWGTEPAEYG